jgi:hypothetical protein
MSIWHAKYDLPRLATPRHPMGHLGRGQVREMGMLVVLCPCTAFHTIKQKTVSIEAFLLRIPNRLTPTFRTGSGRMNCPLYSILNPCRRESYWHHNRSGHLELRRSFGGVSRFTQSDIAYGSVEHPVPGGGVLERLRHPEYGVGWPSARVDFSPCTSM